MSNQKCYVIGRKGAGKSAICEYIVKQKSYNSFSVKLSFKNYPFNELYSLQNEKYTQPNQYITLWKYLIYSNICKMMVENENIENSVRVELEKLYPRNSLKLLSESKYIIPQTDVISNQRYNINPEAWKYTENAAIWGVLHRALKILGY